jgi:Cu/Ag efflux protein CusF
MRGATVKQTVLILAMLIAVGGPALQELSAQTRTQPTKYFCGIGEIISIDADKSGLKIRHHAIDGYMPAMSMHFKIEGTDVLNEVRVGDKVRFTLKDTPELTRVIYVEKIAAEPRRKKKG